MVRLRWSVLILLAMQLLPCARAQSSAPVGPEEVVAGLYAQVVARHSVGIPSDVDLKRLAPFLSQELLTRFTQASVCMNDWYVKGARAGEKPEISWTDLRPFAGEFLDGEGGPDGFKLEKSEIEKDGSVRVFLQVTVKTSQGHPYSTPVDAILIRENGHYAVDDVAYEGTRYRYVGGQSEDYSYEVSRLSQYLAVGCDDRAQVVQNLYNEAMMRRPHDITVGQNWTPFAPYFSHALMSKIHEADLCSAEWNAQNPYPPLKALRPSADDLVTDGYSNPASFQLQLLETEKDGSARMYLRLADAEQGDAGRVAAVVIREGSRYVVDDVIYSNDADYADGEKPRDRRLSDYLAAGCDGPHWIRNNLPNDPAALVQSFLTQIVARAPAGIPRGENWKVFAPYFSKRLLSEIDQSNICEAATVKAYELKMKEEDTVLKIPSLDEDGIFTGGNERQGPASFHIEGVHAEDDGSVRVTVSLTWRDAQHPEEIDRWRLTDVLTKEEGHYVLDDVFFLNDKNANEVDGKLSETLLGTCEF
jgi:hypothetical protein